MITERARPLPGSGNNQVICGRAPSLFGEVGGDRHALLTGAAAAAGDFEDDILKPKKSSKLRLVFLGLGP